jgi:hypothetical protein
MSTPRMPSRSRRNNWSPAANADLFVNSPWSLELAAVNAVNAANSVMNQQGGGDKPPRLRVVHTPDLAEVLSSIEDLWTRMARHPDMRMHVTLDEAEGVWIVLVRPRGAAPGEEAQRMLGAVADFNRYRWMQVGDERPRAHCLVQGISWAGDALAIELISTGALVRYEGADGLWQLQSLMNRLQRVCTNSRESAAPARRVPTNSDPYSTAADPQFGAEYWQNHMRELKRHMDALGI